MVIARAGWQRIAADVRMGEHVRIHDFVNLYGCTIGDHSQIGPFVEIQKGVSVGRWVKIQSHTFICEGVTIEDEVFIGHGVMFINDRHPLSVLPPDGGPVLFDAVRVNRGASIGSNATILGGITIGANSLVGAGSVVTHDVPDNAIVAGNPARLRRMKNGASTGCSV